MNLLGAIEKNAALWDKLLTKGLLGVDSIKRLTRLAPTELYPGPDRLTQLARMTNPADRVPDILGSFRSQMKLPTNPLPSFVGNGFSKQFLQARNQIQHEVVNPSDRGGGLFSGIFNLIGKPNKKFIPAFKPKVKNIDQPFVKPKDFSHWKDQLAGIQDGPAYSTMDNVVAKLKDPVSTRHELGHFFEFHKMSPLQAARIRQRIIARAQEHYPEMLYKARQVPNQVRLLNEATAQGIATSGNSRAAQRVRQLYNSAPNYGIDKELIERANRIDPTGRDAAVINHLLHNYGLNGY